MACALEHLACAEPRAGRHHQAHCGARSARPHRAPLGDPRHGRPHLGRPGHVDRAHADRARHGAPPRTGPVGTLAGGRRRGPTSVTGTSRTRRPGSRSSCGPDPGGPPSARGYWRCPVMSRPPCSPNATTAWPTSSVCTPLWAAMGADPAVPGPGRAPRPPRGAPPGGTRSARDGGRAVRACPHPAHVRHVAAPSATDRGGEDAVAGRGRGLRAMRCRGLGGPRPRRAPRGGRDDRGQPADRRGRAPRPAAAPPRSTTTRAMPPPGWESAPGWIPPAC